MKKNIGGLIVDRVIPGGFLVSDHPGHVSDVISGLIVPGVTVRVDPISRKIEAVTGVWGEPVRVPTHRLIRRAVEKKHRHSNEQGALVEVPFDEPDDFGQTLTDFLNQALAVGVIRHLDDEELKRHPHLYAQRHDKLVHNSEAQTPNSSMLEMLEAFQKTDEHRKHQEALRAIEHGDAK